jgi:O-antigen/teichoic acid export membrane protein
MNNYGGGVKGSGESAGAGGGIYSLLKAEKVVTHNLVLGVGTIVAGLIGVAFQALVSHRMAPADYGGTFAAVTLITFIGIPAGAFALLMARQASLDRAAGDYAPSATLLRRGNRALVAAGVVGAGLLALASPLLGPFTGIPIGLLLAVAAGVPFGLALPLLMGEFQGEQRFLVLSLLSVCQAGLKLVAAVALGSLFGSVGVIAGISLAAAVVYGVAYLMLSGKMVLGLNAPWLGPAVRYLAVIVPSSLALALLVSADVLVVKHYFPTRQAGEYAAAAALGRAIFWGATAVAAVLFPKVIVRGARGRSGRLLVAASLVIVGLGGLVGMALLSVGSTWLLTAFAGSAYAAAAVYLPWYAVGMILLGGVAVMIATHQSRGRPGFLAILIPLSLLEPILLVAFHQTLMQVVLVVDVSMALVLAGLVAAYLVLVRAGVTVGDPTSKGMSTVQHLVVDQ